MKTISIGELRQNPTGMLREVRSGAVYAVTDRGEAVARITGVQRQRWIPSVDLNELLQELGPDAEWLATVQGARAAESPRDPWESCG
ncbi:type II toxin-antitoxin system prevent-host-death family antitoxin [Luteococcus sp. H138]|uniref:type II toxin-antitoxin system Phd/YefM family antitoxin n=1 Tax=unclassified Luteococcus TaxID=2639923 RepID=UPI00313C84B0